MNAMKLGLGALAGSLLLAACTNSTGGVPAARSDGGGPSVRPDGGGAAPPPFGGGLPTTAGGSPGSGDSACSADPSDDGCSTCLKTSCCTPFAACVGDSACVSLIQCGNNCAAGDSACGDQCVSANPSGQQAALALVNCEQNTCASACSGATAPPPSAGQGACLPDSSVPSGAPDCAGLTSTPVEHDCPFGSPDPSCVAAPNGATNVFCCPSGTGGVPDPGGPAPAPGGGSAAYVDPQAVGVWENSNTSGVDYTNGSGSYSSPSGTKAIFQFTADAQYLFEDFVQSSLYSCTMAALGRETGTAIFHGSGFTLAPSHATVTSQDSCNATNNYEKPWQNRLDGPFEYAWSVAANPNGGGRIMTITNLGDGSGLTLTEQLSQ